MDRFGIGFAPESRRGLTRALATFNERVKLFAGFLNALSLGMIGFALLRPATENFDLVGLSAVAWGVIGVAIHGLAHYVLGMLKKDDAP